MKCKSAICGALAVSGGALTLLLTINHTGLKTDRGVRQAGRQENAATYRSRLFLAPCYTFKMRSSDIFLWPIFFTSTF